MLPQQKARYSARAIGCYFGRAGSDGNGNKQVFVPCEILDHDFAGERITWVGTFGEGKSTGFALDSLSAFGWRGDDLTELEDLTPETAATMLPSDVELVCDMEEYNGEWSLKVKWVNVPGGARITKHPLGGGDLKAFAAQMRGVIRGRSGASSARAPAPAARAPAAPPRQPDRHPNAPKDADFGGYGNTPKDDSDVPF